ncbi:hypothetical protein PHMEG_0009897 [Phytophthora megakarya]|uniref:Retroviral polymerase SH3-like domain-containing protein n=1 Tax=Phytophthora megakarya TaxID=4795 RepID=A0A225WFY5_9STRA|nr:hypothetical protein PHMEG_0009897 [Phytophthora megakarya]
MEESEPDVHHQNGVIERAHRTITECARAAKLQAQLPNYLWGSGVFLGCDPQRKGYFVYVTGRDHKVIHSRSVVFLEPPTNVPVKNVEDDDRMSADDDSDNNNSDIDDSDVDDNEEDVSATAAGQNSTSCRRCDNVASLQPLRKSVCIAGPTMSAAKATLDEIIQAPLNIKEARASSHWPK